jgi:putative flippase GtrA
MGVCTTLIFWMFEISFEYMFEFSSAKYYGATIGLSIGYTMKYFLDKKFVFNLK